MPDAVDEMPIDRLRLGGMLGLVGGLQYLLGLFVAEALYPGYDVGRNAVSDLGATCREGAACIIQQPSATIFTAIMLALGACLLAAAMLFYVSAGARLFSVLLGLGGLGVVGAGIFSEVWSVHGLFALLAFTAAPLACLVGYRLLSPGLRPVAIFLGVASLFGLAWQLMGTFVGSAWFGALGDGGVERVIIYPLLFWFILLGTSIVARQESPGVSGFPSAPSGTVRDRVPGVRSSEAP